MGKKKQKGVYLDGKKMFIDIEDVCVSQETNRLNSTNGYLSK